MKGISNLMIVIFHFIFSNLYSNADPVGVINGNLKINNTWESTIYLSIISSFDEMYAITNDMIVTQASSDDLGNFLIDLSFLTKEETLIRIHLVKKGNPPASLIVGGNNENHFFIVANKTSKIKIQNLDSNNIFSKVIVTGSPSTVNFNMITDLSSFPDMFDYEDNLLNKEFVEKVANERLRFIADTSTNSLISLYAIYKSDFEVDFYNNSDYYKNYLNKWKHIESTYFKNFRKQFPDNNKTWYVFIIIFIILFITVGIRFIWHNSKRDKTSTLSIQERKIFYLLKQGSTNQEISNDLHIELSTVKTHVSKIFSKLKIKSRKEILNMK